MRAERTKIINGNVIEEYYWAGKFVVYVNNRLYKGWFEDAVKDLEAKADERRSATIENNRQ